MNRKTKRTIIFICVAVLLIAALLCLTPWPTRVNVQMTGMEVTADGTSIHSCTVHVDGWKLNYLFRDDTAKLHIQIDGAYGLELNGQNHVALYHLSEDLDYATWIVYLSETKQLESVCAYLDPDLNWLGLSVTGRYFIAATEPDADLQAYWEMFADRIR